MTTTNNTVWAIYQRIGFRGAWEYLERLDTKAEAVSRCDEYNRAKHAEPGYPAYKVAAESHEEQTLDPNALTADTITADQIRSLREEAIAHGDDRMVDYCDVVLAAHRRDNADGSPLVWPWNDQPADRDVARRVCADAINAARAQAT